MYGICTRQLVAALAFIGGLTYWSIYMTNLVLSAVWAANNPKRTCFIMMLSLPLSYTVGRRLTRREDEAEDCRYLNRIDLSIYFSPGMSVSLQTTMPHSDVSLTFWCLVWGSRVTESPEFVIPVYFLFFRKYPFAFSKINKIHNSIN